MRLATTTFIPLLVALCVQADGYDNGKDQVDKSYGKKEKGYSKNNDEGYSKKSAALSPGYNGTAISANYAYPDLLEPNKGFTPTTAILDEINSCLKAKDPADTKTELIYLQHYASGKYLSARWEGQTLTPAITDSPQLRVGSDPHLNSFGLWAVRGIVGAGTGQDVVQGVVLALPGYIARTQKFFCLGNAVAQDKMAGSDPSYTATMADCTTLAAGGVASFNIQSRDIYLNSPISDPILLRVDQSDTKSACLTISTDASALVYTSCSDKKATFAAVKRNLEDAFGQL